MSDIPLTDSGVPAVEAEAPDFLLNQSPAVAVDIMMDSGRVTGELRPMGAPRRLVDTLNSADAGYVVVHSGQLTDPFSAAEQPREFEVAHIGRDAILFASPRGDAVIHGSSFDAVKKIPARTTLVLPGFEIRGNMFFLPDADPAGMPMLTSHHFIPLTDATIVPVGGRLATWQEPLLIVNLGRALFYAPRKAS